MNIRTIRNYLSCKIGSRILIIYYGSRNRKEKYCGVLLKVYYNIFTVKLCTGEIKSFSYNDILTGTIKVCI